MDLYTPEIAYNATISDLTKTKAFDELRVVSILNEIGGKDHSGTKTAPVPTIFGMNFQSLNAAKKISGTSGYTDHIGTPDALLADGLYYVDGCAAAHGGRTEVCPSAGLNGDHRDRQAR